MKFGWLFLVTVLLTTVSGPIASHAQQAVEPVSAPVAVNAPGSEVTIKGRDLFAFQTCPAQSFTPSDKPIPGSKVQVELDPSTLWQPRGGDIRFIVRNWPWAVNQTSFTVCFRWRYLDGYNERFRTAPLPVRIISNKPTADGEIVAAATVPSMPTAPQRFWGLTQDLDDAINPNILPHYGNFTAFNGVPLAEVLIRIGNGDGQFADTILEIGVTSRAAAAVICALLVGAMLFLLWLCSPPKIGPFGGASFILRIIADRRGRASLSQLQILVWSLVIGGGAIYVITLTGTLIDIKSGTLIMLGISGSANISAELRNRSVAAAAALAAASVPEQAPAAEVPAAEVPAAEVNAPAVASVPVTLGVPHFSDVVTNPGSPEIDVTKVQMLFFTMITALFVAIKIVTSYTIPDIPEGFLLLMGISNGVYVSRKFI